MGVLTGLTADKIGQLSASRIKALTAADIVGMTAAQLPGLTASQLALFGAGQLAAFSTSEIPSLSAAALAGLGAKQIAWLTPAQIGAFTIVQISSLNATQIAALNVADIMALSPAQVKALTGAQVAALSAAQLSGLSAADIALLSPAQAASINPKAIAALNAVQLRAFTAAQLSALSAAQIARLTSAQIASLAPAALAGLSGAQIAALTAAQFSGLNGADIAALSPAQVSSFSVNEISALSAAQLKALTAPQLAALTKAEISRLTAAQIKNLAPASLAGFTKSQIADLTAAQLAGLTPAQISALGGSTPAPAPAPPAPAPPTPAPPAPAIIAPPATTPPTSQAPTQLSVPSSAPPPLGTQNPTVAQLAAMTGAQIAGLSAGQIDAFTPAQLAALNLNYNKMLTILQTDASAGMMSGEFSALQALAAKLNVAGGIAVSPYLQQITDDVVLGNPANATWTGGSNIAMPLGNLTAASSQTQADELLGKWFLGTDLPDSHVNINGAPNFTVTQYAASTPLYDAQGPSLSDINQGNLGDCFFLAPLAEVAAQNPSAIQSMITDNGNGTYGVCFTIDGNADYVTVDNQLADGGTIFNHASDDWAGLVEKAYAQLQGGGNVTGNPAGYGNSYTNLANGGSPEAALEAITGAATVLDYDAGGSGWTSYTFNGASLTVPNSPTSATVTASAGGISSADLQAALSADLVAGDYLILSSNTNAVDSNGNATLMADHAMAVFGYDAADGMFDVYNPWGTQTGATQNGGSQPWDTTFEVGLDNLLSAGDIISVASNNPMGAIATPAAPLLPPSGAANAASSLFGAATG